MQAQATSKGANEPSADQSIGRIVSVTGSKAIVLLDGGTKGGVKTKIGRPEMGTLLAIDTATTVVLAIVSALSVPVPAQRDGDTEVWIAELGLVGELWKNAEGVATTFNRGTTIYPALGDRVRVASKAELQLAFCGTETSSVRVGAIRQDSSIAAMVRVDDLLGKHFAILGTTGTGKSCTTALILRAILERNPNAHLVLLDPHNEYATAFSDWAEVISPRNMQLPLWLLNFEEAVEVLIGDTSRKAEIEILQELIPLAKSRYSMGRGSDSARIRRGVVDVTRFTVDTPVPYRISDLMGLIDERMGKLENKKDLAPYRQIKTRIDSLSQDGRYAFMFGSLTVYDGMSQILSRIFRVPVNGKPITILELTGLPTEIVNVVVSVLCRMTFDFALWSEGQIPVTLVCEEAHRYVPLNASLGFEPCKRAIAKIAKEGRKYGASLCIVTQRPAEIDPTILSQCNTVFALRMSNDHDQAIVTSAISDTGSGLLEFLPTLGQREAIAFGDGVPLPVRIRFDELPKKHLPRSSTARFSEKWQVSVGDEGFLDAVVERWRASGMGAGGEGSHHHGVGDIPGLEAIHGDLHTDVAYSAAAGEPVVDQRLASAGDVRAPLAQPARAQVAAPPGPARAPTQPGMSSLRRDPAAAQAPAEAPRPSLRRDPSAPVGGPPAAPAADPAARLSLRDRLLRPQAAR